MKAKIKQTFDQVHADSELRQKTSDFLAQKIHEKSKPMPIRRMRVAVMAMACLLIVCLGGWSYFTPTSVVSIDVNPSLELRVNRFDKVLSFDGYNEDGRALAASLPQIRFMDYNEALDTIMNSAVITDCLARDEWMSIAVAGQNETQTARILEQAQACTAGQKNTHCYASDLTQEEVDTAHELGLSFGKYRAYVSLQELDPQITPEEVQSMTMREIRQRIAELTGESGTQGQGAGNGNGSGNGNGNGAGNGNGTGMYGNQNGNAGSGTGMYGGAGMNGTGSGGGKGYGKGRNAASS